MIELLRRSLAVVLSVALAIGLVVHSAHAGDMGVKAMAPMTADMPTPGKCDDCCGDQKSGVPVLCSAYCSTVVAMPIPTIAFTPMPGRVLPHAIELTIAGYGEPPEPYPPRPAS